MHGPPPNVCVCVCVHAVESASEASQDTEGEEAKKKD